MNPHFPNDGLLQRLYRLEQQNEYLQSQNDLLHEAIETICAAFLNDSRNLDAAIQTAMTLQQRARQEGGQIQRPQRNRDLEID
jgi:hypothetical protein